MVQCHGVEDTVSSGGHPVTCTGVTIVDHDGTLITRLSMMYDFAALLALQPAVQAVADDADPPVTVGAPPGGVTKDE